MIDEGRELSLSVRIMTIRDGTHGISIAFPDKLLGEWTDSGARTLTLTEDYSVSICGKDSSRRYLLTMPGTPLRGEQLSETEATVVIRI